MRTSRLRAATSIRESSDRPISDGRRSFTFPSNPSRLTDCPALCAVRLPSDTSLGALVCTYGFYALPPNLWIPCTADIRSIRLLTDGTAYAGVQFHALGTVAHGCFLRALRFGEDDVDAVWVAITQEDVPEDAQRHPTDRQQLVVRALQPPLKALEAAPEPPLTPFVVWWTPSELRRLEEQVRRMFHLDDGGDGSASPSPYAAFHALMPAARGSGFARLFRSPTLFEDCVKTVSLCNSNWPRITAMNDALAKEVGVGSRYQLQVLVHAPPPERVLLDLTTDANGVKESAQSRKMRAGADHGSERRGASGCAAARRHRWSVSHTRRAGLHHR